MTFELWLYAAKQLAQTYEMSQVIYQQLPQAEKDELQREYRREILGEKLEETGPDGEKRKFNPGDIVKHFKRETVSKNELAENKYLYQIIGEAEHSDTGEKLMVYQALYGDFRIYVRPLSTFMSKTDKNMFPKIKQDYRFEKV